MTDRTASEEATPRATLVVIVSVLLGLVYMAANLSQSQWDPAGPIQFGVEEPERVAYAERVFGREIPVASELGHDGRFFFIQAMDPLLLQPAEHAAFLDRPSYRAQRMLYPALASIALPFGPEAVAWLMLVINLAGYAVGTWATVAIAGKLHVSRWWGLAFALNPGVRFELEILGAGVVALALVMLAISALLDGEYRWAVAAVTGAVLTREVMLIAVIGLAIHLAVRGRRTQALFFVGVPAVGAAVWAVYVRMRLTPWDRTGSIEEIGLPFDGLANAARHWAAEPGVDLLVGATFALLALAFVWNAWRNRTLLDFAGVGFAFLAFVLTEQVWLRQFNISRALSPLLTLYLLGLAARVGGSTASVDEGHVPHAAL